MYDDALILITPDRWKAGVWEVNGKDGLTLAEAKAEVLRQMDEYVHVERAPRGPMTESEKRILKCLEENPYQSLLDGRTFVMDGERVRLSTPPLRYDGAGNMVGEATGLKP